MSKKEKFENYRYPDRFGELLGYRLISASRRKKEAILALELKERHLSPAGRVHGGVISGFFDSSCGAATFTTIGKQDFASTVELKVNYFKPLEKGDRLRCRARVVFRGKRLCAVEAQLFRNREKEPVAMAIGTFYIVSKG